MAFEMFDVKTPYHEIALGRLFVVSGDLYLTTEGGPVGQFSIRRLGSLSGSSLFHVIAPGLLRERRSAVRDSPIEGGP
jgi:hypothetical protein